MSNKKLKKYLRKIYEQNNQVLYVESIEERYKDDRDCELDIFVVNPEKSTDNEIDFGEYLFTIINKKAFIEYESIIPFNSYRIRVPQDKLFSRKVEDINAMSYTPFYCDRRFFLNKDSGITHEDILMCTKYFVNEVLDAFLIWNIDIWRVK